MSRRLRFVSFLVALAVAVGLPVAASATPTKGKPHAGQFCSHKKAPPAGFKCVKSKDGRYRLKKK